MDGYCLIGNTISNSGERDEEKVGFNKLVTCLISVFVKSEHPARIFKLNMPIAHHIPNPLK